ncbi:MAG: hypothetical protein II997_03750 [Clostridia bacterium]|nr:hypothetical protein [Clostridia bacterium]
MNVIKNWYAIVALVTLMVIRLFASGEWFGSVVVAGVLVTWIDTTNKIWHKNSNIIRTKEKVRFAIVMLSMSFLGVVQLVLIIVNLVVGLKWLNSPLILDEITLMALLICVIQNEFIDWINNIIKVK